MITRDKVSQEETQKFNPSEVKATWFKPEIVHLSSEETRGKNPEPAEVGQGQGQGRGPS